MTTKHDRVVSPARRAALAALLESTKPQMEVRSTDEALSKADNFDSLEPRDRALANRLLHGVLQNLRLIDFLIDVICRFERKRTSPNLLWILRLIVYQKTFLTGVPDYAIGEQAVAQARETGNQHAAKFINALARRLIAELPPSVDAIDSFLALKGVENISASVRYSVPDEIADAMARGYGGDSLNPILKAMCVEETRVWLRVNTVKVAPNDLTAALSEEDVATEPSSIAPGILLWNSDSLQPWRSEAWRRGELTVQDLGAYLAVELLAPLPGETIIDWCAAPGGKTGQMWERMKGQGRLIAQEVEPSRREVLVKALLRLYGADHRIEIVEKLESSSGENSPLADALLIDAPCMGLGLIRRHPEIRWDGRISNWQKIQVIQKSILTAASRWVRPGGRVAWVTCSPTLWENEEVLGPLLDEIGLDYIEPKSRIPPWAEPWVQVDRGIVRTRPDLAPVDGFAIAILTKR